MMDSLGLNTKFDVYDFHNQKPPYTNVTFLQTLKLFKYVLWYTDNNPSLDLAASSVQKYLDVGWKDCFFNAIPSTVDPSLLQSFLPINSDSLYTKTSLYRILLFQPIHTDPTYPTLTLYYQFIQDKIILS